MFNKLKQFKDLRDKAKTIQTMLGSESVSVDAAHGAIKLSMDGNMNVTSCEVDASLLAPENKKKVEDGFKDAFQDAIKKIQRIMATKMKDMGGLDQFKM
jgi:DNA-binding protein YbaB